MRELSKNDKYKGYDKDEFIWAKEYNNDNLDKAIKDEEKLVQIIEEKLEKKNKILGKKDILKLIDELKE